jgi:hypothetical protein
VTDRKQGHIDAHILHPIKEENHPKQEQQVVVPGDHVFGPEIQEREEQHPAAFLDITLVPFGDIVGIGIHRHEQQHCQRQK